jgi:PAS domain S-box-containing protein
MAKPAVFKPIINFVLKYAWNREVVCRRPPFLRLFVPAGLALIGTWLITGPVSFLGQYTPFLTYFGIIFFSACYGGSRSAFVASLASTICVISFIYPSYQQNGKYLFAVLIALFFIEALMLTGLFAAIKLIQQRYKVSEETFRGVIEKNAEGFLMTDEQGVIKFECLSVIGILGYDKGELLDKNLQELIHPDEIRSFNIRFLKVLVKDGHSMPFLQRLKTKQGEWKWIEGCVNNMLKDASVNRIVFNYRNVTDRVNQTKQQEDFVHMAAHELKTPITALRGYLQLMEANHRKEQRHTDNGMLDRMNKQTDRILNLIDEMLNVTRIRAGELQYHFNIFDLNECIRDVVHSMQTTTQTHLIKLITTAIPLINGDKDRISQVLTNMISNAIKYSPNDPEITVTVFIENDFIVIRVKDQGIGIPKEQQKKIFERFYRADSLPKNTYQGLGLGLYIAMDIVKKHGGKMGVNSEAGNGAEFWFTLPVNTSLNRNFT